MHADLVKLPLRQESNIFNLAGITAWTLKKHGHLTDVSEMTERVFFSKNYIKAIFLLTKLICCGILILIFLTLI